ncbi:hypothetical protein CH426_01960 [Klebsiella aerogenes]|nr:hypothetical protein CH426_01960 [Klebsiella aerogenes]
MNICVTDCPAALRLRGPTGYASEGVVGRVRRSRHPAQKRLRIRCHDCPAALCLRGPTGYSSGGV